MNQNLTVKRSQSVERQLRYIKCRERFVRLIERRKGLSTQDIDFALRSDINPSRQKMYDLDRYENSLYITDVERDMTHVINGLYRAALRNKFLSYQILSGYVHVPKIHILTINGVRDYVSQEFIELASPGAGKRVLFLKPVTSAGGLGAQSITVSNGMAETSDGPVPLMDFLDTKVRIYPNLMVSETLTQSKFMSELFPGSINTTRILTVRDPDSREVFAARAVVRVGNNKSAPVDNYSSGGYAFDVDIKTGVLGFGASKKSPKMQEKHPDTGKNITGMTIPRYADIIRKAEELHRAMPYINYVGWDLCIGEERVSLVEANNTTDVDVFQIHRPLLEDSRLVKFYRHHHII